MSSPLGPQLQLQPVSSSPGNPLPYKEPARTLDLKQPPRRQLNLKQPPRQQLSVKAAPTTLSTPAATAAKSAPLATTALLATGFVLGTQIGNVIYSELNPDDPNFNDYLSRWMRQSGVLEPLNLSGPGEDYEGVEYAVPFEGGQTPGVEYEVEATWSIDRERFPTQHTSGSFSGPGPISRISLYSRLSENGLSQVLGAEVVFADGVKRRGSGFGLNDRAYNLQHNIRREDGQPDTGGNPASSPVTSTQPGNTSSPQPLNLNPGPTPSPNSPSTTPQLSPVPTPEPSNLPEPEPESDPEAEERPQLKLQPDSLPLPSVKPEPKPEDEKSPVNSPTASGPNCGCNPGIANNVKNQLEGLKDFLTKNLNVPELAGIAALTALVQQLIQQVTSIAGAVGVDAFPMNVPATINQCDVRPGKQINNLAESQLWQTEQLDSVMGQWCNTMTIDTPSGPQEITTPDLANSQQEIMGMLAALTVNSGLQLNLATRTLTEVGATKQQSLLAHLFAKGNAEYLGYEGQRQKTSVPFAFGPGKDLLDGFLGESQVPVKGWKNTDSQDLKSTLTELLAAAAIIRSAFWRRLDPNGNVDQQLRDIVNAQAGFPERDQTPPPGQVSDWEAYLNQVEQAFGTSQNPYGRTPDERPNIVDKPPPEDINGT